MPAREQLCAGLCCFCKFHLEQESESRLHQFRRWPVAMSLCQSWIIFPRYTPNPAPSWPLWELTLVVQKRVEILFSGFLPGLVRAASQASTGTWLLLLCLCLLAYWLVQNRFLAKARQQFGIPVKPNCLFLQLVQFWSGNTRPYKLSGGCSGLFSPGSHQNTQGLSYVAGRCSPSLMYALGSLCDHM